MTNDAYIKSQLATFCWREASMYGGDTVMTAVAMAIRNRVRAGWGDWLHVIAHAPKSSFRIEQPLGDQLPDLREPGFQRFLSRLDSVYDGSAVDITGVQQLYQPMGTSSHGLYWADLANITSDWFRTSILESPEQHKRTATVTPFIFFG